MGAGGDARPIERDGILTRIKSLKRINSLQMLGSVKDDLQVLKSIWFTKQKGDDHAQRLENFYGAQAHACTVPLSPRLVLR